MLVVILAIIILKKNGTLNNHKKYGVINYISLKPFKNYLYQVDISQAKDQNNEYNIQYKLCGRLYIYSDLSIKKVFSGISDKNEDEVEQIYYDAMEEVKSIHQATVDFFGEEIFK